MPSILLIEDSPDFILMVTKILNDYKVFTTEDSDEAFHIMQTNPISLILLDITLPKKDGYTILNELQSHPLFSSIPVICLTGKTQVTDKVTAFSLGADDYIVKPFDPIEFKARIDSRIAKTLRLETTREIQLLGDITIDYVAHKISDNEGKDVPLTQTEFKILKCLGKHPGNVLSREQLLSFVWGDEGAVFDRAVDVHICSLRKKLKKSTIHIKAVLGVGYKLFILETSKVKAS